MITLTFAVETYFITVALCCFIQVALAINVVKHRRRTQVKIGDGNDPCLQAAIRALGNFSEYTPITLVALGAVTAMGAHVDTVFVLCFGFLLARLFHLLGLLHFERSSQPTMAYRLWGMGFQILVLTGSATVLLLEMLFNGFNPF